MIIFKTFNEIKTTIDDNTTRNTILLFFMLYTIGVRSRKLSVFHIGLQVILRLCF